MGHVILNSAKIAAVVNPDGTWVESSHSLALSDIIYTVYCKAPWLEVFPTELFLLKLLGNWSQNSPWDVGTWLPKGSDLRHPRTAYFAKHSEGTNGWVCWDTNHHYRWWLNIPMPSRCPNVSILWLSRKFASKMPSAYPQMMAVYFALGQSALAEAGPLPTIALLVLSLPDHTGNVGSPSYHDS